MDDVKLTDRQPEIENAKIYTPEYYEYFHAASRESGSIVLRALHEVYQFRSIVDVGSGSGAWLDAASRLLVTSRLLGLDGEWAANCPVYRQGIPFKAVDLADAIDLGERFELAICVEVAEHLPLDSAEVLISTLANLSDVVLFAAAIPGQGGTAHVNEQWPYYWANQFHRFGYVPLDFLRRRLWGCGSVQWWYRQNLVLYVRRDRLIPHYDSLCDPMALLRPHVTHEALPSYIHPEFFNLKMLELEAIHKRKD